jgi:ABC-type antimicrobial peptide transport system permease subunit
LAGCFAAFFAASALFRFHTCFIFKLNAFFSAALFGGLRFALAGVVFVTTAGFAASRFFAAQISFILRLRALRCAGVFDLRFRVAGVTGFTFLATLDPTPFNSARMLSIFPFQCKWNAFALVIGAD